jgi:hypothetical protein
MPTSRHAAERLARGGNEPNVPGYDDEVLLAGWVCVAGWSDAAQETARSVSGDPRDEDPATILARCYRAGT